MPDAGVAILVLAAGGSSRMGRPKQLLAYAGKSLVRHVTETALAVGTGQVVVVIGAAAGEVGGPGARPAGCSRSERAVGKGDRLVDPAGVSTLVSVPSQQASVVILLGDQPLVTAGTIRRLIDEQARTAKPVCAAAFDNTIGPPVLVTRPLFPQLLALPDDRGAKHIWAAHPEQVHAVPCPEAATDLDTPADYSRWSGSPASDCSAG